jgi:hypothetical protein
MPNYWYSGGRHLHAVLTEYQAHYNFRPHQGIAQRVPDDECNAPRATRAVAESDLRENVLHPACGSTVSEADPPHSWGEKPASTPDCPHRRLEARESATARTVTDIDTQQIHRKPVLGGLINEYMYAA